MKESRAQQKRDRVKKMSPEQAEALKKLQAEQKRDRVKKMSPEEAEALKKLHAQQEGDRVKKMSPEEAANSKKVAAEGRLKLAQSKVHALERAKEEQHQRNAILATKTGAQRGREWMAAEARLLPDSYFPGVNARISHSAC